MLTKKGQLVFLINRIVHFLIHYKLGTIYCLLLNEIYSLFIHQNKPNWGLYQVLFNTRLLFQNHAHAFGWKRRENRPYHHGTEWTRNNKGQEWPPHNCRLKLQDVVRGYKGRGLKLYLIYFIERHFTSCHL